MAQVTRAKVLGLCLLAGFTVLLLDSELSSSWNGKEMVALVGFAASMYSGGLLGSCSGLLRRDLGGHGAGVGKRIGVICSSEPRQSWCRKCSGLGAGLAGAWRIDVWDSDVETDLE